ncbi:MAG: hypothetical protein N4A76_07840 [Firmicutes bacterium]|jgi:ribosomal protein S18 acetylase RimI-like enzyme|nr:hypothetical protein [Bacillota bacterium]
MEDPLYKVIIEEESKRKDILRIFFKNYLKLIEKYCDFYTIDDVVFATVYRSKKFDNQFIYKLQLYYRISKSIGISKIIGIRKFFRGVSILMKMSSTWIDDLVESEYSHIDMIATELSCRGQGYLSSLFEAIIHEDEVYTIETHNIINTKIYEKYGFELVRQIELKNTELIQYCMIRVT